MKTPLAHYSKPNAIDLGLYIKSVPFVPGSGPQEHPIATIADFDRLIAERRPDFVMFGFFGFPRRGVTDLGKARKLVEKLLRQYARGDWRN